MHDYTPKRENNSSLTVPILLFVCAGLCLILSSLNIGWRLLWQIIALCTLVAGVQITTRYKLTTYTYVVENKAVQGFEDEMNRVTQSWGDSEGVWLRIVKTQGKNSRTVAGFPVTAVISAKKRVAGEKSDADVKLAYNFCNNMFSRSAYVLILVLNGQKMRVTLEPDDYIISLFNKKS